MKKLMLVLLIAVLPVQAVAAIVEPLFQQGVATSEIAVADHTHHDGEGHNAPAPGHEHPFTADDRGSDHCGAGCASAIPATAAKVPATPSSERSPFLATSFSGHIPEQPQRPPRAVLL